MSIVNIHIGQLVLDGIDVPANRRHLLQAAVENELSRLFTGDSVDRLRARDGASSLPGGNIKLSPEGTVEPRHLGKQIAGAVKDGVDR